MIELRTHEGRLDEALLTEWALLCDDDPTATVFHTPRFLEAWQDVFGANIPTRVHTFHVDGRLVGVIPDANDVENGPSGPLEIRRFQGGIDVTDYLGPVCRPEYRPDVLEAYVAHLAADVDWDEFVGNNLAVGTGVVDGLRQAIQSNGLHIVDDDVDGVCPIVDISEGFDAYLASLPGRQRQELLRKSRKLARDLGEISIEEVSAEHFPDRLDAFIQMATDSHLDKAQFFKRPGTTEFFARLGETFASDRTFRLHELHVGGVPAAATLSFVHNGVWGLYNSAYAPNLEAYGPGVVLITFLIEQAAKEQCHTFDLLRGDEAYKYRFGATDQVLQRLAFRREQPS